MGYGVSPIAVPLDQIESAILDENPSWLVRWMFGSRKDELVETIKTNFAYKFEQDELDDEDEPTLEQALKDILNRNDFNSDFTHKYSYAFELLCNHFGESLDNSQWSAMRSEWVDEVDERLKSIGIEEQQFSVSKLFFQGPPIAIPEPMDFPFIGFLRADAISEVAQVIDLVDTVNLPPEILEAVTQIRGWLLRCLELKYDLVCFYY